MFGRAHCCPPLMPSPSLRTIRSSLSFAARPFDSSSERPPLATSSTNARRSDGRSGHYPTGATHRPGPRGVHGPITVRPACKSRPRQGRRRHRDDLDLQGHRTRSPSRPGRRGISTGRTGVGDALHGRQAGDGRPSYTCSSLAPLAFAEFPVGPIGPLGGHASRLTACSPRRNPSTICLDSVEVASNATSPSSDGAMRCDAAPCRSGSGGRCCLRPFAVALGSAIGVELVRGRCGDGAGEGRRADCSGPAGRRRFGPACPRLQHRPCRPALPRGGLSGGLSFGRG